MEDVEKVNVFYNQRKVGTIAKYQKYLTVFAYDSTWQKEGFSISPFSLPLREEPFVAKQEPFDGLFGVFADSLPDGWGRLLVDRLLLQNKIDPRSVGNLERLAIVGASGMGALTYEPEYKLSSVTGYSDLDKLSEECSQILAAEFNDNVDELFSLGGSSGGARPKILTKVDHSKNFSFIYLDDEARWELSPAYDLTYSYSIGGEHATTVDGNGKNPDMKDILAVAKKIGINVKRAKEIAVQVQTCVQEKLGKILLAR